MKKIKKSQKTIAIILVFIMVLACLPLTGFAETTQTENVNLTDTYTSLEGPVQNEIPITPEPTDVYIFEEPEPTSVYTDDIISGEITDGDVVDTMSERSSSLYTPLTIRSHVLPPSSDTYIYSSNGDTAYGSSTELWVSSGRTSYLKYDLSFLPEGAIIINAYIYVPYYYNVSSGYLYVGAYEVEEPWSESTLTWNNANSITNISSDLIGDEQRATARPGMNASNHSSMTFNITELANKWVYSGVNNGLALKYSNKRDPDDDDHNSSVILLSKENSNGVGASLFIDYVVLEDGVYSFKNVGNEDRYMDIQRNRTSPGYHVQQYNFTTAPESDFSRSGLYKISRDPETGKFIIRLMLNNLLSFGISGSEVLTKQISMDDTLVLATDMFTLEFAGDGYRIKPYNSSLVVSTKAAFPEASGASGGENSYLTALSETAAGDNGLWIPTKYTGDDKYGLTSSVSGDFIAGEQVTVTAVSWSTVPGANRQNIYVHSDYTNVATSTMNTSTAKMTMDIHTKGTVRVIYEICDDDTRLLVKPFQITWNTKLMIPNGEYFFQSLYNESYMSLDSIFDDNIHLELLAGNNILHQRWIIEHVLDGYYTLTNAYTYDLASIPDGYETENDSEDTAITLFTESESTSEPNRQLWKFSRNSDGSYIIKPKEEVFLSTDWRLAVSEEFDWDEKNVQIRLGSDLGNEAKWYVYSTTYHLVNYYDSSFLNLFENNEATMIEHIELANAFAELVYKDYYGIDLVMEDPVEYTGLTIDGCPNGDDQPCTDACGDCYHNIDITQSIGHHKNLVNISNQLYDDSRPDNYIIVFWTNRGNVYCNFEINEVHYTSEDTLACVVDDRPVIHVLKLVGTSTQWEAIMGVTLAHELTHTFGMYDMYKDNPDTTINELTVHAEFEVISCAMQEASDLTQEVDLYNNVKNFQVRPFCPHCEEVIGKFIVTNSYMQGNN